VKQGEDKVSVMQSPKNCNAQPILQMIATQLKYEVYYRAEQCILVKAAQIIV